MQRSLSLSSSVSQEEVEKNSQENIDRIRHCIRFKTTFTWTILSVKLCFYIFYSMESEAKKTSFFFT